MLGRCEGVISKWSVSNTQWYILWYWTLLFQDSCSPLQESLWQVSMSLIPAGLILVKEPVWAYQNITSSENLVLTTPRCSYFFSNWHILLIEEILHLLIGSLSHYLQGFIHPRVRPRWCRISSINSSNRTEPGTNISLLRSLRPSSTPGYHHRELGYVQWM